MSETFSRHGYRRSGSTGGAARMGALSRPGACPRVVLAAALVALAALLWVDVAIGAFPGQNGRIAYSDYHFSDKLLTVEPDGTGVTVLVENENSPPPFDSLGHAGYPSWSADGQRLAVRAWADSGLCPDDRTGIYSLGPTGGDIGVVGGSCLLNVAADAADPTWSPDSSTVAYLTPFGSSSQFIPFEQSETPELWTVAVDGSTSPTRIVTAKPVACPEWAPNQGDGYVMDPAWSPEGSVIAFAFVVDDNVACAGAGLGIWTVTPDGSSLTQLIDAPGRHPDWSPDGSKIVFVSASTSGSQGERGNIWVMDADGSDLVQLTSGGLDKDPVWSPDGTLIAFVRGGGPTGPGLLHTMAADGSGVVSLGVSGRHPSWQPLAPPPSEDGDGDGVADSIDSGAAAFDDGAGTSGAIVDAAGLDVLVEDADDSGDGVKITVGPGSGKATFSVCGFTLKVSAGSEIVVTCGSVRVEVVVGAAEIDLGGGAVLVSVPEGGTAKVTEEGGTFFSVDNLGSLAIDVTVDGELTSIPAGGSATVSTDTTDPTVTCQPASFIVGEPGAVVSGDVIDEGSGPVSDVVSTTVSSSWPGSFSASLTAHDQAGHSTMALCPYTVSYLFVGFEQPIDKLPTVNNAKAGQTVPIKWRITDYYGVGISDPASFVSVTTGGTACDSSDPQDAIEAYAGGSGLQYTGNGRWQFNWKTPKSYAGTCKVMRLNLADGNTTRIAEFMFK